MPNNEKRSRAWLVRWDSVGAHAAVKQRVAAVLPWQLGFQTVGRIIEAIYAHRMYEPVEMLSIARNKTNNPYPYRIGTAPLIREDGVHTNIGWEGEVACGHNPSLLARQAWVWTADTVNGSVEWEDLPRPSLDWRQPRPAS